MIEQLTIPMPPQRVQKTPESDELYGLVVGLRRRGFTVRRYGRFHHVGYPLAAWWNQPRSGRMLTFWELRDFAREAGVQP